MIFDPASVRLSTFGVRVDPVGLGGIGALERDDHGAP